MYCDKMINKYVYKKKHKYAVGAYIQYENK